MKRPQKLPVTDHAVLRWVERFGHVDVEAIREQIWRETREALASGASRLTINGVEYRMANGRVIMMIVKRPPCRELRWPE